MLQFVEFLSSSDEDCEEVLLTNNEVQTIEDDSFVETQPITTLKFTRPSKDKENLSKKQETIALMKQLNTQYIRFKIFSFYN